MFARLSLLRLVLILAALVGCSSNDTIRSGDGPKPADDSTPDDEDEAASYETTSTEEPTTTAAPAQPSTSPYLAASGNVVVPDGGQVS